MLRLCCIPSQGNMQLRNVRCHLRLACFMLHAEATRFSISLGSNGCAAHAICPFRPMPMRQRMYASRSTRSVLARLQSRRAVLYDLGTCARSSAHNGRTLALPDDPTESHKPAKPTKSEYPAPCFPPLS